MRKILLPLVLCLICANPVLAQEKSEAAHAAPVWQSVQAENLLAWLIRAEDEAIGISGDTKQALRGAIDGGDAAVLHQTADAAALLLLRAYHGKCCGTAMPANWHIKQSVTDAELRARIADGLASGQTDLMIRANRPDHPHYRALTAAYAAETAPARRLMLARNLARWRSLPIPQTGRYLIVNAAAQELTMWDGNDLIDRRRVIVGKKSSRTPVFAVQVSGVVLNPWWNIPSSIAAEGIGSFVRRNPKAARARGYIYSNGRYRQMPGDNNALGRMKLVMPNRFTVFLHDTSNRELFAQEERTLSHGCVRVDGALDFAALLLGDAGWDRALVDEAVAEGETQTVPLAEPMPLFIAYFTAEPDGEGGVRDLPDIYGRDR